MAKRKTSTTRPIQYVKLLKGATGAAKRYVERRGLDWDVSESKPEKPPASEIEKMSQANAYKRKFNTWAKKVNRYAQLQLDYEKGVKAARSSLSTSKKRR